MVVYNFKKIETVPTAKDFIDVILSKTQRKTPTVVHPGYNIVRIRQFYMRKVKYTHMNYHDKLTQILTDFPRLDDIHPFYADLVNVLYDRDHFKLALGQLNLAKQLIDRVGRDYVKLLKYGDSLYRCKSLKRAALGRMCTVMKRQKGALEYLEQVRQHMMRLPAIDPATRTIIIAGYPNVGKSSFMNRVTRANVDVQPCALLSPLQRVTRRRSHPPTSSSCGQVRLHHQVSLRRPLGLQVPPLAGHRHAWRARQAARGAKHDRDAVHHRSRAPAVLRPLCPRHLRGVRPLDR
mmetsp:Transcript_43372/g.140687  ORF Transcript_43372/g.140687 Transcript_43372/m.140687 type:complete len:292 (-) Transcript_43372:374-1249(-)